MTLIYEADALPCKLCGGQRLVEVLPVNAAGSNDMQADDCPWCLQRDVESLREQLKKANKAIGWHRTNDR